MTDIAAGLKEILTALEQDSPLAEIDWKGILTEAISRLSPPLPADASTMQKYTSIQPVVMDGFPDAHHVFLQATNQRFCVSPHGCNTKQDAEWLRDQLCVALAKIVEDSIAELEAELADFTRLKELAKRRHEESKP
jgi:hypothetical protein